VFLPLAVTPIVILSSVFQLCDFTLRFENETEVYSYAVMRC
jgi:hypothetical protein